MLYDYLITLFDDYKTYKSIKKEEIITIYYFYKVA